MRRLCYCVAIVLGHAAAVAGSEASGTDEVDIRARVTRLIADLDSEKFETRRKAARALDQLAADEAARPVIAEVSAELLVSPTTSFEVRKQLEQLARRWPPGRKKPAAAVTNDETDELIAQLENNSYAVRLGATRRLEWLLDQQAAASPLLLKLERRLADPRLSADAEHWLTPMYDRAWGAWLLAGADEQDLNALPQAAVRAAIEALAASAAADDGSAAVRQSGLVAERTLRMALARRSTAATAKEAIESYLAAPAKSTSAAAPLKELLDLTHAALVAEFWEGRQHGGSQFLLVGVPSVNPGGISHFDRVDERTAHCASGVNLAPGDYPLGIAFPHPYQEGAMFHLVSLPTAQARMAYPYQLRLGEPRRLEQITRRTIDWFLARKQPLSEAELVMLDQLDPPTLSRRAGELFTAITDDSLTMQGPRRAGGRPSHHGMICATLAYSGTKEAAPALLAALDGRRFLAATTDAPYELGWIAALAIAQRDPWEGCDGWLAGLVGRTEPLAEGQVKPPQLGATAAAILLKRRQLDPIDFSLEPLEEMLFADLGLGAYRFVTAGAMGKIRAALAQQGGSAASR